MQGGSDGNVTTSSIPATSGPGPSPGPSIQLYREVHKHAYLRHITSHGKKSGDQYWVVFCVHCDTVPYLEFYSTQATSVTHQPIWRMCLSGTTTVSGALVPQGKLYRLTLVTRESGITLAANTWEDMKDWVDTLRAKLREMKILSPSENLYSKPPEQLVRNRAPTRDPTSPLPPPPPGPIVYVPGTEVVLRSQTEETRNSEETNNNGARRTEDVTESRSHDVIDVSWIPNWGNEVSQDNASPSEDGSVRDGNVTSTGGSCVVDVVSSNDGERRLSDSRDVNRLHVSAAETVSEVVVQGSQPYEALKGNVRSKRYENHSVTTEGTSSSSANILPKITSESVSKMKDFSKMDRSKSGSSRLDGALQESVTKVCKDGGLILYNDGGSLDIEQRSFSTSNPEQWNDLNAALRDNMCISPPVAASGSRVAKISGMNVCLVDSLLPNRNTVSSDDEFEFSGEILHLGDVSSTKGAPSSESKDIVNIKRDSKGYTQVDVNTKKVELNKNKVVLPGTTQESLVTVSGAGCALSDNVERTNTKKPTPLPRSKFDNSTKTGTNGGKPDGVYVSLSECNTESIPNSQEVVLREAKDRKKVSLNRTSSVPDSIESEHILHAFCGEMVDATLPFDKRRTNNVTAESNITIISVSSSSQERQQGAPSTAIPIVGRQFNFDQINDITNAQTMASGSKPVKSYVNVSVTNIDNDNGVEIRHKLQGSSGYGHIRHSSTRRGFILDVDENARRDGIKRTSLDGIEPKQELVKSKQITVDNKSLEIPEFKQNNNVHVIKRTSTTHTKDFYESVFGPFSNNDNNNLASTAIVLPGSGDKIIVQVPKLVVNIPNSSQLNQGQSPINTSDKSIDSKVNNKTSNKSQSDQVFVNSRQIVEVNRETTATRVNNESDYEFLAWNCPRGRIDNRNDSNQTNVSRICVETATRQTNINIGANDPNNSSDANLSKRSNLFTRGLTELNIMSKFRNLSNNNQTTTQATVVTTTTGNPNNSSNNNKKSHAERNVFGAKFNNIFNKFSDSRSVPTAAASSSTASTPVVRNRNVETLVKFESSLRRNWSEHNDRTAPLTAIRGQTETKPARPRPPALTNISPRRQSNNQSSDLDNRRRSNSLSSARISTGETNTTQETSAAPLPPKPLFNVPVMSLREQQVMRLRNEMGHSGGIRLLLSSRDSPEQAVALVDIYSGVWVAGWKQRSHPLLYNALHIGDRLHSVDGCVVNSARQARRVIQNSTGHKVEIIIKRLPHGRVYALKRDTDRQDLGLIMESANITGIVPNSPAHRAGVLSSGTLTEVNGRPLNLLLKKGSTQVKDRLTSVGREVSILVQPTEFVSLLRTALKAVRGCKDYIVQ